MRLRATAAAAAAALDAIVVVEELGDVVAAAVWGCGCGVVDGGGSGCGSEAAGM